ncbi:MAG: heme-dependent oxidative N-demethylase subunit alpha family protein [Chthoniobacteraceae bacterium]
MSLPLDRLVKDGAFEFQMGMRRGGDEIFQNRPENRAVLDERRQWLASEPEHYAACEPAGEAALAEAVAFARSLNPSLAADSLLSLGANWEPDFLLLRQDDGGEFRLVAGGVCFPTHWALRDKIGHPLAAIHAPVPTLNATLKPKIDAFLASLRADTVWERWNWGLAATAELNNHPSRDLPRLTAASSLDTCWFRAEHQAFRLLPETRTILFAIRIELVPLAEFANDPALAFRLAAALRSMPDEIAAYKGVATARFPIAALLEANIARQS